jgi:O-antigen ligase
MLSNEEVRAIESGIANCFYIYKPGIIVRLHQVLWEYKTFCETGFLNAHSVLQRYEFWKASKGIIKEHFWFGVGTGDINNSFRVQYEKMNTSLDMDHRWRSHNQYMSIFVVFGVVGFVWFIITLFYPIISTGKFRDFLYMSFFIIATLSMLTEDTIESQAGVTFFAFFNAFLLFYKGNDE